MKQISKKDLTIEEYLFSRGYILHDDRDGVKTYVNNLKSIRIYEYCSEGKKSDRIVFNINGYLLFDVSFKPSLTMLEYLLKKSTREYTKATA